ncbi:MAG: T9SS type A sorting domain-containing protein, partial [Rubricoccaceae bacterium]|nr:T9SS type A sorting domain-containing protein [Rubricoccaceae bacterium]
PNEPAAPPQGFALNAAYPNPFRSSSVISFSLEQPSAVRLDLFDALGRRVAVLADGSFAAGQHEVVVDGYALRPGLYIARLSADGVTDTIRIVRGL